MQIEKSKVLIQFLLIFRQSGDVLFLLYVRRFRGYTATDVKILIHGLEGSVASNRLLIYRVTHNA